MARHAVRPFNPSAARTANDRFYQAHPEMVRNGRRIPLDPRNPEHAGMRSDWLSEYERAGGEVAETHYSPPPDDPVEPCTQCHGALAVTVADENAMPVRNALVQLQPGGRTVLTDERGLAHFEELPAPEEYSIVVYPSRFSLEVPSDAEGADLAPTASNDPPVHTVQRVSCDESLTLSVVVGREEQYEGPRCPNGCGMDSASCMEAQRRNPDLQDIVHRAQRLISWGNRAGFTNAVSALRHYFDGTGTFRQIPQAKVDEVRASSGRDHKEKLIRKLQSMECSGGMGVRGRLAKRLVEMGVGDLPPATSVLPLTSWPAEVTLDFSYANGIERAGADDDNLTYYGTTLRSMVSILCTRLSTNPRGYRCAVSQWEQYVYDNYDWEDDKAFGGFIGAMINLPNQSEMNLLQRNCCARSYQRSSAPWFQNDPALTIPDWDVVFDSDAAVSAAARCRVTFDRARINRERADRQDGALPVPQPVRSSPTS